MIIYGKCCVVTHRKMGDIMFVNNGSITIRGMKDIESDYKLMAKWLSDDKVLEFYQGRDKPSTIEDVKKKYGPRTKGESYVSSCIIEFEEIPIGYLQYYPTQNDEKKTCGYSESQLIYGVDLFIGEVEYQDRGVGSQVIKTLIEYIKASIKPEKIIIDPRVDNKRAIRCYEKCGFIAKNILKENELHEGVRCDNLLMEINCI